MIYEVTTITSAVGFPSFLGSFLGSLSVAVLLASHHDASTEAGSGEFYFHDCSRVADEYSRSVL